MKILVMGGTSFVSKNTAVHYIEKGHEVTILTRGQKKVDYEGLKEHIIADRKNLESLKQLTGKKFDVVFDVSAYDMTDMENFFEVLEKDNLKKYIFVSSGAVYNPSEETEMDENHQRGKNINWGSYGENKYLIEEFLFKKYREEGLPVSIVRPTYLYGEDNILYREYYFFKSIREGQLIPIPDSNSRTQFIYIKDLMKIFDSLIENKDCNGEAFNVTNPEIYNFEEMISVFQKVLGIKAKYARVGSKENYRDREYFPYRDTSYILSVDKSRRMGVYVPDTSLEKGLIKSLKWIDENKIDLPRSGLKKLEEVRKITLIE